MKAVDKVIEKAKVIAAHLLEASADDVEFSGGRFVRGTDQGVAMAESRWRRSRRTTCRTAWRPRSTPTRRSTR